MMAESTPCPFKAAALSETEDVNGNAPHVTSDRVSVRSSELVKVFDATVQRLQGKISLEIVKDPREVVEVFGRAAAARGKPFQYVQIDSHGDNDGKLTFQDGKIHARYMIENLVDAGVLERQNKTKKGSTVEFFSCFVGQDFEGMRKASQKYGITILAANYAQNQFGVSGRGNNIGSAVIRKLKKFQHPNYKVPVRPGVLTFTPSGKVFESDGTQITEIKYR